MSYKRNRLSGKLANYELYSGKDAEMEELEFYFKGILIGFIIAAPIGAIGALCVRRTITEGRRAGLLTGLGAAMADGVYGAIAGFGLTYISHLILQSEDWLRPIAGVFLLAIGIKIFISKPAIDTQPVKIRHSLGDFSSAFFLGLTNPLTILAFLALFSALGLDKATHTYLTATALVIGVICGSILCWLLLIEAVSFFREKINHNSMTWVNKITGMFLLGCGVIAIISTFIKA